VVVCGCLLLRDLVPFFPTENGPQSRVVVPRPFGLTCPAPPPPKAAPGLFWWSWPGPVRGLQPGTAVVRVRWWWWWWRGCAPPGGIPRNNPPPHILAELAGAGGVGGGRVDRGIETWCGRGAVGPHCAGHAAGRGPLPAGRHRPAGVQSHHYPHPPPKDRPREHFDPPYLVT